MFNTKKLILQTRNLGKQFTEADGRLLNACQNINLNVYQGKTLAIVGESGCGKSTLVKIIMGMTKPSSGNIFFHGEDLTKFNKKQRRESYQKMQMVFQDPYGTFNPKMQVIDVTKLQTAEKKRPGRKGERTSSDGGTARRCIILLSTKHEWRTETANRDRQSVVIRTRTSVVR